jgi:hypothetical protein
MPVLALELAAAARYYQPALLPQRKAPRSVTAISKQAARSTAGAGAFQIHAARIRVT